jgi:aconitase B
VGDLNTGHGAVFLDEGRYAREHRDVVVLPDSVIAGGDASTRLDGGGFHHYESGATYCAAAQVYQMPVRRESIDAGILAHRRHGDPIAKRDFADG